MKGFEDIFDWLDVVIPRLIRATPPKANNIVLDRMEQSIIKIHENFYAIKETAPNQPVLLPEGQMIRGTETNTEYVLVRIEVMEAKRWALVSERHPNQTLILDSNEDVRGFEVIWGKKAIASMGPFGEWAVFPIGTNVILVGTGDNENVRGRLAVRGVDFVLLRDNHDTVLHVNPSSYKMLTK